MPSENAPAPEKPVVMWQYGRQLTHCLVTVFGQRRFSIGCPFSTMGICFLLPRRIISIAVKMPAGSRHTIVADTELKVMEVQLGRDITVHDKEKFPFPEA